MNVEINANCTGCEECIQMVPELFTLTPDFVAKPLSSAVPAELEDDVRDAAANCPAMAIKLT